MIDGVLLAVETSGPRGGVAVAAGGSIVAQVDLTGRSHARMLVPSVARVLEEAGIERHRVDAIVVGAGPGSFTGVRIAAATAKALSHALTLPLFAVSSLAAAAAWDLAGAHLPAEAVERVVLFDARGDRVFAAAYRIGPEGWSALREPGAHHLGDLLDAGLPVGSEVVGDGAERHRSAIEARGHTVVGPPAGTPGPGGLLFALRHAGPAEPVADVGRWEPDYLRDSSAERERRARR